MLIIATYMTIQLQLTTSTSLEGAIITSRGKYSMEESAQQLRGIQSYSRP
jgi:hypothetical protein